MITIKNKSATIIFGDSQASLNPESCTSFTAQTIQTHPAFKAIGHNHFFASKPIILLKQTHSAHGVIISEQNQIAAFAPRSVEGDFIITSLSSVSLAILTADCIPLIIVDQKKHILAAVHAGWKGLVNGIIFNVLQTMNRQFQCDPQDLCAWLGPSGRACCYEVQADFVAMLQHDQSALSSIQTNPDGRLFFDLATYAQKQLLSCAILKKNIQLEHALCTICSTTYCSFRRNNGATERNITVATLL